MLDNSGPTPGGDDPEFERGAEDHTPEDAGGLSQPLGEEFEALRAGYREVCVSCSTSGAPVALIEFNSSFPFLSERLQISGCSAPEMSLERLRERYLEEHVLGTSAFLSTESDVQPVRLVTTDEMVLSRNKRTEVSFLATIQNAEGHDIVLLNNRGIEFASGRAGIFIRSSDTGGFRYSVIYSEGAVQSELDLINELGMGLRIDNQLFSPVLDAGVKALEDYFKAKGLYFPGAQEVEACGDSTRVFLEFDVGGEWYSVSFTHNTKTKQMVAGAVVEGRESHAPKNRITDYDSPASSGCTELIMYQPAVTFDSSVSMSGHLLHEVGEDSEYDLGYEQMELAGIQLCKRFPGVTQVVRPEHSPSAQGLRDLLFQRRAGILEEKFNRSMTENELSQRDFGILPPAIDVVVHQRLELSSATAGSIRAALHLSLQDHDNKSWCCSPVGRMHNRRYEVGPVSYIVSTDSEPGGLYTELLYTPGAFEEELRDIEANGMRLMNDGAMYSPLLTGVLEAATGGEYLLADSPSLQDVEIVNIERQPWLTFFSVRHGDKVKKVEVMLDSIDDWPGAATASIYLQCEPES